MQDSTLHVALDSDPAASAQAIVTSERQSLPESANRVDGAADWNALLRDLSAIANSGGGKITLRGTIDETELHRRFPASDAIELIVDKREETNGAASVISVGPSLFPIEHDGQMYFRHGETSEPATSADVRAAFERMVRRARRRWLRGVKRVLDTPIDSLGGRKRKPSEVTKRSAANLQPVRIVTDPNAPALHPSDIDHLYPWRQKDLVQELNRRLGGRMLNSYDIQAVRRHHRLDDRPDFVFNLPGAGRRYSPAVADWIMEEFTRDLGFFHKARLADQEVLKLRRRKPK